MVAGGLLGRHTAAPGEEGIALGGRWAAFHRWHLSHAGGYLFSKWEVSHRPLGALSVSKGHSGRRGTLRSAESSFQGSSDLYQVGGSSDDLQLIVRDPDHLCGHRDRRQGRRRTDSAQRGWEDTAQPAFSHVLPARMPVASATAGGDLQTVQRGRLQF